MREEVHLGVPQGAHVSARGSERTRRFAAALVERAVGATIHVVSKREYAERGGGPGLTERVADRLRREGRRPYVIPVGGSDAIGAR